MKAFPFDIPNNWTWTTMGEIANVIGGGTPRTTNPENYDYGTIPWITPADLSGYTAKQIAHGERNITQKGLDTSSARMMPAGTILFSSRAPVGYVAIASNPVCTNQGFKSFVLKTKDIIPDYVYWWLKGSKDLAESFASGTTFLELSGAKAKQIPIPIAPPRQQKLIVTEIEKQFSRLDEAIANLTRVRTNLKRYRATVLKAAVEGRLVPPESELAQTGRRLYETGADFVKSVIAEREDAFSKRGRMYREPILPDHKLPILHRGWCWASWDQISVWVTYGFTRPMPHVDQGVPIVTAKHVLNGRIQFSGRERTTAAAFEKLSAKDKPNKGDILITKDGTIGRSAIVETADPFCINQSVAVVWLCSKRLNARFLRLVIESPLTQRRIWTKARGVAIQHLSITDFARMPIPVPPFIEQERIVAEVERRLSVIEELEAAVGANLKRAERFRQSTLGAAFSGELVAVDKTPAHLVTTVSPETVK